MRISGVTLVKGWTKTNAEQFDLRYLPTKLHIQWVPTD